MTTIPAGNPKARDYPGEAVQIPETHEPDAYSYELSYADMLTVPDDPWWPLGDGPGGR
jgi:hypothetical protein